MVDGEEVRPKFGDEGEVRSQLAQGVPSYCFSTVKSMH